jgi:hypothetical protein
MANKSRNKKNQPPTGEGKKQSPRLGESNKLNKRAEVLQASYAEQNIGSAEEEEGMRPRSPKQMKNPNRPKAGR